MKRISILTSVIICVALFVACTNAAPSLECKARTYIDSLVIGAKNVPKVFGDNPMKTLQYVNTTFSDEELCVLSYTMVYENKRHNCEFIIVHSSNDDKNYIIQHFTDTFVVRDHFHGFPVADNFDMKSKEFRKQLLNTEGLKWHFK